MLSIKVKKAYETHIIGFNNSSLPLGARKDLHILYEQAKLTDNKRWLNMFEDQPADKELEKIKEEKFNEKQELKK